MEKQILFTESQGFKQWWLLAPLIVINGVFVFAIISEPDKLIEIVFPFALVLLITIGLAISRLNTQIKEDGIYVRFFPFHRSVKHFTWDKFKTLSVQQYSPLVDYGGWGLRIAAFTGKGKAYTVSGDRGLQIVFTDDKKLMIGTQKVEEMKDVLKKLGRLSEQ